MPAPRIPVPLEIGTAVHLKPRRPGNLGCLLLGGEGIVVGINADAYGTYYMVRLSRTGGTRFARRDGLRRHRPKKRRCAAKRGVK